MERYQWDLKEIERKICYARKKLKEKNISSYEKERLQFSLVTYKKMLEMSGDIKYTAFYNLLDSITASYISEKRVEEENRFLQIWQPKIDPIKSDEYFSFLLKLTSLALQLEIPSTKKLNEVRLDKNEKVALVKRYYQSLSDLEISDYGVNFLSSKRIHFAKRYRLYKEKITAQTFRDYAFDKSYILVMENNTLKDPQNLAHELMHTINYQMNEEFHLKKQTGFLEVAPYTSDLLFIDYLETLTYPKQEIEKLRTAYFYQIHSKAIQFHNRMQVKLGLAKIDEIDMIDQIRKTMTPIDMQLLYSVQSLTLADFFHSEICENPKKGLKHLKSFIKTSLNMEEVPDFSFLGITCEKQLETMKKRKQLLVKRKN